MVNETELVYLVLLTLLMLIIHVILSFKGANEDDKKKQYEVGEAKR
jgi:hypothetical protein